MTNSHLNNWIIEFKQRLSAVGGEDKENEKENEKERKSSESDNEVREFSPIILISPPSLENF